MIRCKNMTTANGNAWANQIVIELGGNRRAFQSYNTLVALWDRRAEKLYINKDCWFSNTTTRALKAFVDGYTGLERVSAKDIYSSVIKTPGVVEVGEEFFEKF